MSVAASMVQWRSTVAFVKAVDQCLYFHNINCPADYRILLPSNTLEYFQD